MFRSYQEAVLHGRLETPLEHTERLDRARALMHAGQQAPPAATAHAVWTCLKQGKVSESSATAWGDAGQPLRGVRIFTCRKAGGTSHYAGAGASVDKI